MLIRQRKEGGIYLPKPFQGLDTSVSRVVEFPGACLGRLRTINFELISATYTSEAATEAGRASVNFTT